MFDPSLASGPSCACTGPQDITTKRTIPQCQLEDEDFAAQINRYRQLSAHIQSIERQPRRIAVRFSDDVPLELLQRTLEIEGVCCSFFGIGYDRAHHQLTITVDTQDRDTWLDPLFRALNPQAAGEPGERSR